MAEETDVAGLVERLDSLIMDDPPGGNGFRVDPAIEARDVVNAASTIRAQAAEIELLTKERNEWQEAAGQMAVDGAISKAKLRLAVEVTHRAKNALSFAEAAPTIRALVAERDAMERRARAFEAGATKLQSRAEAAEAKLREAVELIRRWHIADLTGHDGSLSRARQVSEAFLATMEKQ